MDCKMLTYVPVEVELLWSQQRHDYTNRWGGGAVEGVLITNFISFVLPYNNVIRNYEKYTEIEYVCQTQEIK